MAIAGNAVGIGGVLGKVWSNLKVAKETRQEEKKNGD